MGIGVAGVLCLNVHQNVVQEFSPDLENVIHLRKLQQIWLILHQKQQQQLKLYYDRPLNGGSDCEGSSSETTPCSVKCDSSSENFIIPYYRQHKCNELTLLPAYQTDGLYFSKLWKVLSKINHVYFTSRK